MATLDAFLPDVLVHVPNAPDPYVRQAIVRAARRFCMKTLIWKAWVPCVASVAPNEEVYTPTLPAHSSAIRLDRVTRDGKAIHPQNYRSPDRDWRTYSAEEPEGAVTDDLVTFVLTGPNLTGTIQAQLTLMPSLTATQIPALLATKYMECIAAGAVAHLLRTKAAPWYAPQDAALHEGRFEEGFGSAGTDVMRGQTRETPRSRINWC